MKNQRFSSEIFQFLEVKFSIYLNKPVFVMGIFLLNLYHFCLHTTVFFGYNTVVYLANIGFALDPSIRVMRLWCTTTDHLVWRETCKFC